MDSNTGCIAKESQVQMQLGRCAEGLNKLESEIGDLEKKLDRVILPPPPKKETPGEPEPPLVILANNLKSLADRIIASVEKIKELKNRIEL